MLNTLCKVKKSCCQSKFSIGILLATVVVFISSSIASPQISWADSEDVSVDPDINLISADDGNEVNNLIEFYYGENGNDGFITFQIVRAAEDDAPGEVIVSDGKEFTGGDLVLDAVFLATDSTTYEYGVTGVGSRAFQNNITLKNVTFVHDLTYSSSSGAIGTYAFSGCTSLESVTFPSKVAGIGDYAFQECTVLKSVEFPDDAVIYSAAKMAGIGDNCFRNCVALEYISIPAVLNGLRQTDYYYAASQYHPFSTFQQAVSTTVIQSGYSNKTYSSFLQYVGLKGSSTSGTFNGCTNLKTIVFKAGNPGGTLAYFGLGNAGTNAQYFSGCSNLTSLVFESAEQPYFIDQNRSIAGEIYWTYWGNTKAPTCYYAVDYYLTDDPINIITESYPEATPENADSSDIYVVADAMQTYYSAQDRISRVEYARDTPISALATSDAYVLSAYMYENTTEYAEVGYSDGLIPDPNAAAAEAGFDTSKQWVWKLTNTQCRRQGLTESCSAYLAPADDISAGRVSADQITIEYKLCDQNLSRGFLPSEAGDTFVFSEDVGFDVQRYFTNGSYYRFSGTLYNFEEGDTAWFTLNSTASNFYKEIEICAADGAVLDPNMYEVSFQAYDINTGVMYDAVLGQDTGPLLMTITPAVESGYTGILQEWVLTENHTGTVKSLFTESSIGSSGTWYWAQYYESILGSCDAVSGYSELLTRAE